MAHVEPHKFYVCHVPNTSSVHKKCISRNVHRIYYQSDGEKLHPGLACYAKTSRATLKGMILLVIRVIPCPCYCRLLSVWEHQHLPQCGSCSWGMISLHCLWLLFPWGSDCLFCCVGWTLTFLLVIIEYKFLTWIGSPMVTAKDVSDKCIEMCNKKNILWCFIHQSVKRDAMINSKCSCNWTVAGLTFGGEPFFHMSIHKVCIEDLFSITSFMGKHHSSWLCPHAIWNIMFAGLEEPSAWHLFNWDCCSLQASLILQTKKRSTLYPLLLETLF
jgi:hypothetical protein